MIADYLRINAKNLVLVENTPCPITESFLVGAYREYPDVQCYPRPVLDYLDDESFKLWAYMVKL